MSLGDELESGLLLELYAKFFDASDRWPNLCHLAVNAEWLEAKFQCVRRNSHGALPLWIDANGVYDDILAYPLHAMGKDISNLRCVHDEFATQGEWSLLEFEDTMWYGRYYSLKDNNIGYQEAIESFIRWGTNVVAASSTDCGFEQRKLWFELLYKGRETNRFSSHINPPEIQLPFIKSIMPLSELNPKLRRSRLRGSIKRHIKSPDVAPADTPLADNKQTVLSSPIADIGMQVAWLDPNIFLVAAQTVKLRIEQNHVKRESSENPPSRIIPSWKQDRREFWYNGKCLKAYKQKAQNQTAVLAAFEEEGWPDKIDDPLPGTIHEPKARMRDTIRSLNYGQKQILFSADGTGEGILWEPKNS